MLLKDCSFWRYIDSWPRPRASLLILPENWPIHHSTCTTLRDHLSNSRALVLSVQHNIHDNEAALQHLSSFHRLHCGSTRRTDTSHTHTVSWSATRCPVYYSRSPFSSVVSRDVGAVSDNVLTYFKELEQRDSACIIVAVNNKVLLLLVLYNSLARRA